MKNKAQYLTYQLYNGVYVISESEKIEKDLTKILVGFINEIYSYDDNRIKRSPIIYEEAGEKWKGVKQVWNSSKCVDVIVAELNSESLDESVEKFLKQIK